MQSTKQQMMDGRMNAKAEAYISSFILKQDGIAIVQSYKKEGSQLP
jgi:hypothetical protein